MNTDTKKNVYYVVAFVVIAAVVWATFMWMTDSVETPKSTTPSSTISSNTTTQEEVVSSTQQSVTYLISEQDETLYCNGDDMDSDGYRKTITKEVTALVPKGNGTQAALAKAILGLATKGNCRTTLMQSTITISNGIVFIPAMDGWAGISIAMCSCTPQVEVNMLRLPGITKVVWQGTGVDGK
jgi:hypothetical protein